jgi:probable rRNA maturation factor
MKRGTADPTLLSVIVTDERGCPIPAGGLARWLTRVAPVSARGAVGIALVSDARVRALNRKYLGHDHATDVLSFPAADSLSPVLLAHQPDKLRASRLRLRTKRASFGAAAGTYLGDIVIARGVARRQAHAAGHGEPTELRVLALHGLLHLLGYDHERDHGMMARVERRLRRKGGLAEGLLDRAAAPGSFGPSVRRPFDLPTRRQGQGGPMRRRGAAMR